MVTHGGEELKKLSGSKAQESEKLEAQAKKAQDIASKLQADLDMASAAAKSSTFATQNVSGTENCFSN